ncbi:C-factor [Phlebotomus papatasi]|uniref:C-factor n=1 Tax=Phlebotomus papatasi TaxID=29031 RepID=UPI0024835F94|nr:C-factor [Phlebotomus papatasi]
MNSILITGCNRGLGLGLVKCLVRNGREMPKHLLATVRNAEKAQELQQLAKEHSNIHILEIDLTNFDEYEAFAKKVDNIVKEDGLNVLFNSAGLAPKSTRLPHAQLKDLRECFEVNSLAPVMMTKAMLPLLQRASALHADRPIGPQRACVVNMTSVLGSIGANDSGGLYAYRMSKAALNAATKSMSLDLRGDSIMAICLHPGWVRTDMGGQKAPLDVETSVSGMVKVIDSLQPQHNGKFLQFDGKEIEW